MIFRCPLLLFDISKDMYIPIPWGIYPQEDDMTFFCVGENKNIFSFKTNLIVTRYSLYI